MRAVRTAELEEILAVIERIVRDELDGAAEVRPEQELIGDLGLDSLGRLTLAVGLEDHFHVALAWSGDGSVRTVLDLAQLVLAERARAAGDVPASAVTELEASP
jgi:acyl carrier protein